MQRLIYLNTKSKLIIMLLLVSLGSMLTMAYLGWRTSQDSLIESAFNNLISVRSSKGAQIESFFENLENETRTLAEEESVISAMVHLNSEFKRLDRQIIEEEWVNSVEQFYTDVFFPELEQHSTGKPSLEFYSPKRPAALYLQHHYISANSNPIKEKRHLVNANDGSDYSRWHERYHPLFSNIIERFGYYDLFLIDFDTNDVIYTVNKQVDLGTNLTTGPYSESSLARVVDAVHLDPQASGVQAIDFQPYVPSCKAPAAFFAIPIFNGPHIVGILAIELPVEKINRIMTGDENWEADGLGQTGETYLVGPDMTMRSNSRFLIEDKAKYLRALSSLGTSPQTIKAIEQFDTSIIYQPVETDASKKALTGQTGIQTVDDYHGVPVLSAYAPLQVSGFDWGILTDISIEEVMAPVEAQRNLFLIAIAILIAVVSLLAIALSYYFTWPVRFLINQTDKIQEGQFDVQSTLSSKDEYGRLSRSINEVVDDLRQQRRSLENEQKRNDSLLLNILPQPIVERMKRGETQIVNHAQQATVLYAEIVGFRELAQDRDDKAAARQLNELFRQFDVAGDNTGIEQHPLMANRFLAACGVVESRIDHTKRVIDFTLRISELLHLSNQKYETKLALQAGIHTGSTSAGLIGGRRFHYDLWGEGVETASALQRIADPGSILVTQPVYDQINSFYPLTQHSGQHLSDLKAWSLNNSLANSNLIDLERDLDTDLDGENIHLLLEEPRQEPLDQPAGKIHIDSESTDLKLNQRITIP